MGKQRVQAFYPLSNRETSIAMDAHLINGIVEKGNPHDEVWIRKRPGYILSSTLPAGQASGITYTYWGLLSVFGNNVYVVSTNLGSLGAPAIGMVAGRNSSTGTDGNTILINTSAAAWVVDYSTLSHTNTLTNVTSGASFAGTTLINGSAYLDGTYYLASAVGIYASDLNDPTSWPALNVLKNQSEGDDFVYMAQQLVYIIMLKQFSIDVYYDAANPTGSPLGRVGGGKQNIGCFNPATVQNFGELLVWVGNTVSGPNGVYAMEGLKLSKISTPAVERLIFGNLGGTLYSFNFSVAGHVYYCLTSTTVNYTLAYDFLMQTWYIWQSPTGSYMPIAESTVDTQGNIYLQDISNGNIYTVDPTAYADNGVPFALTLQTDNIDFGSRSLKNNVYVDLVTDQVSNSVATISYTTDDFQTFSTPLALDLSQDRVFISDLGEWRKIAFNITHNMQLDFRIKALEFTADAGSF